MSDDAGRRSWLRATLLAVLWAAQLPGGAMAAPPIAATADVTPTDGDDDGEAADDADADFDFPAMPTAPTATASPTPPPPRSWSLTFQLRSDEALWVERLSSQPLAKARQSVDAQWRWQRAGLRLVASGHAEWDGAYLFGRERYDDATLEAYEHLLMVRDTFAAVSLGPVELTVGRQVVVYGEGDGLSPLDLLNPRDLREPGLADLADIRVPVLATRVGYFRGAHRLELTVVHEAHFGFRTPPNGPFSPLPAAFDDAAQRFGLDADALLAGRVLRYRHEGDRFALATQQALARWVYRGEGVDLGVVAGSVLDQQGVVAGLDVTALVGGDGGDVAVPLRHLRYEVLGTTGAWALGRMLFKWEFGLSRRRPVGISDPDALPPTFGYLRRDTVEAMFSAAFRPSPTTMLGLEAAKTTPLRAVEGMLFPVDATTLMARASHSALRERLDVVGVALVFGARAQYGWLARADVSYLLRDGLRVGAGAITYQPSERFGPFAGLDRHDRVMVRLSWNFAL